jgi:hypothetical protein
MKLKSPSLVYLVLCLWCWAPLAQLQAIPFWVTQLSGDSAPVGGVQSPTTTDLIAWWGFGNLLDASGNDRTVSGVSNEDHTTGLVGNCVRFDASGEYGRIDNASWQTPTGSFTVGAWVRTTNAAPSGSRGLLTKMNFTSNSWGLILQTSGAVTFYASGNGSTLHGAATSSTPITANQWYFVVGVFTSSTSAKVYIDGTEKGSDTTDIPAAVANSGTVAVRLNHWAWGDVGTYAETRLMDEAFMFNRALTPGEITWLYNGGAGRSHGSLTP